MTLRNERVLEERHIVVGREEVADQAPSGGAWVGFRDGGKQKWLRCGPQWQALFAHIQSAIAAHAADWPGERSISTRVEATGTGYRVTMKLIAHGG